MSFRRALSLLLTGALLAHASAASAVSLTVSPDNFSGVGDGIFEGWGTSLCWWANRIGYSDTLASLAAEAFCNPETGLGLNIVRYNIGGGDDPAHDHITRTDSMMEGFWADPAYDEESGTYTWTYDWTRDAGQRNVLAHCREVYGPDLIVEGFSNSPPYFMTRSGCSSGAKMAFQNNLRDDAYDAFAQYLVDVAEHFAGDFGIRFQSLSPMNEPNTSYWGAMSAKQEGCHFDPGASQSRILVALSEKLREKGLSDILVSGTDETSIDTQALSLSQLTDEALAAISRVDTHSYAGSGRDFLRSQTILRGKNLWMSEVDGGDTLGKDSGEMGAGLWLARRIMEDLNGLTPGAWILWQVIDSHISSKGYLGRTDTGMVNLEGGYWGCAVMDHDREELLLTQKYYVFGQFTRFIRPGMRLIAMQENAVAAQDPGSGRLVLVLMNASDSTQETQLDLTAFGNTYPAGLPVHQVRTSGSLADGEHWAELEAIHTDESGFTAVLAPYSVTTFVVTP